MKTNAIEKIALVTMVALGTMFTLWIGASFADLLINGTDCGVNNIFANLIR